jgi:hypothetical protein
MMNIELIREFFGWMVAINVVLYIWSAVMCIVGRKYIQKMHGKWFGLSPEAINAFLYGYLGVYKVVFLVFVFVPWIALLLIG